MKWWAIIKMIADIIANLPFNASEETIKAAVAERCSDVKTQDKV